MNRIASIENLHEAFLRAAKGKSGKQSVRMFRTHLDKNIEEMSCKLMKGIYKFGQYHFFTVYDPKKRLICAASFPERIVFHAMMRICHPVFENYQTNDSFASRKGRGQYAALERTQQLARRFAWFAKLDMCKYFDSIDHCIMLTQLARLFKDRQLLIYFRNLIDGYEVTEGRGLPIGKLTSQYFANHYLAVADHYAKQQLHIPAMVRYMDDILFFAHDKEQLMEKVNAFIGFVYKELHLSVHSPVLNHTYMGIPFLGYVVKPDCLRLNGHSLRRFRHKMGRLQYELSLDIIDENTYVKHATCLMAFAEKAEVMNLKKQMQNTFGMYPLGH